MIYYDVDCNFWNNHKFIRIMEYWKKIMKVWAKCVLELDVQFDAQFHLHVLRL